MDYFADKKDKTTQNHCQTTPSTHPAHGGYRELKSYQIAEVVYDATTMFCHRFIDRRSRTDDQMVQTARSGKQYIAEGCMASGTPKKTELKLVGVARASLEESLLDFQGYRRQRGLRLWGKDHPKTREVRGPCATNMIGSIRPIGLIFNPLPLKSRPTQWLI